MRLSCASWLSFKEKVKSIKGFLSASVSLGFTHLKKQKSPPFQKRAFLTTCKSIPTLNHENYFFPIQDTTSSEEVTELAILACVAAAKDKATRTDKTID